MEKEGKVLVLKRIHVQYTLRAAPEHREKAEQVHEFHADYCPVYRSIHHSIQITTELRFAPPD